MDEQRAGLLPMLRLMARDAWLDHLAQVPLFAECDKRQLQQVAAAAVDLRQGRRVKRENVQAAVWEELWSFAMGGQQQQQQQRVVQIEMSEVLPCTRPYRSEPNPVEFLTDLKPS